MLEQDLERETNATTVDCVAKCTQKEVEELYCCCVCYFKAVPAASPPDSRVGI